MRFLILSALAYLWVLAATIAERIGAKPFVVLTFLMFSFFPLAIVLSTGFRGLLLAYVIGVTAQIAVQPNRPLDKRA